MTRRISRAVAGAGDALRRFDLERRRRGWVSPIRLGSARVRVVVFLLCTLGALGAGMVLAQSYLTPVQSGSQIGISEFQQLAVAGQLQSATFYDFDHRILGTYVPAPAAGVRGGAAPSSQLPGLAYWTTYPSTDAVTPLLFQKLTENGVQFSFVHQTNKNVVQFVAQYMLPLLMLANLFALIFLAMRGGGGDGLAGVVQFGRIGRRGGSSRAGRVTFANVAGADEALAELREVRDYLADPARFAAMGAQPPKGVLLFGPPGCGKTLLAKAIAGEADVPFFSISGAEFVESLVGIGAARVRDLFKQVRQVAPAIIFIDEIDAAGRKRGGVTGGQEEREQTLNQLLVEMDGFEAASGIVVMGATNRPDILDPALLRPGRFDRQVTVEPPDLVGRQEILQLHARGRPLAADVDFEYLARRTPGYTGADLANVVNEAALLSVRFGRPEIGLEELEEAVLRVIVGPKRRGHLLTAEERKRVALHECGHAVVAAAVGRLADLQRVSIIGRGRSLGHSATSRQWQERVLLTRSELRAELVLTMGGLAAEEMMLGEPSTGGESDLVRATELAQVMAGRYGMSERVGKVSLVRSEGSEFLGGTMVAAELTTGPVLQDLHQEVRRLIEDADSQAIAILTRHRTTLLELSERLVERETLEASELEAALELVRPESNVLTDLPVMPSSNGSTLAGVMHAR